MLTKILPLLFLAVSFASAQSPANIALFPGSLTLTVDQAQETVTIPNASTVVVTNNAAYAPFATQVFMYENAVTVEPYAGIAYSGAPVNVSITIKPRLLPRGLVGIPINFSTPGATVQWNLALIMNLNVVDTRTVTPPPVNAVRFIPHLAVGGGWSTELTFLNSGAEESIITLEYLTPHGNEIPLVTFPNILKLKANRTTSINLTSATADILTGTVRITANGGQVATTSLYQFEGKEASLPSMTGGMSELVFSMDMQAGQDLGVAFMNTSNTVQTARLLVYNEEGTNIMNSKVVMEANGQRSYTLSKIIPEMKGKRGLVKIISEVPCLAGFSLRFSPQMAFTPVLSQ